MLNRQLTVYCLLATLMASIASVSADETTSGYYKDSQKGWWWGKRPAPEEQKEPQEQPKEVVKPKLEQQQPQAPFVPPPLKSYSYDDIWDMHPDQFYELQEAYKKKAVQNPTYENTKDYWEMSEIARKKADAFMNTSEYVWQKHPEITVAKDYPMNTPGKQARFGTIEAERMKVLQENRERYALIFFVESGCPYCEEQDKILKWFENQTGWIVKPVDIHQNPQAAARVGVQTTPSLVLIKKGDTKDYFPVASGVVTSTEIEDLTYRAVRLLNGDLKPEGYSTYEFEKGSSFDDTGRRDWVR